MKLRQWLEADLEPFAAINADAEVMEHFPGTLTRAVMERLGMSHDPDDDFDHPGLPEGDPLSRHVLYRLAR